MAKINILSQNLINLIAAGEVVERPASVLKELLENSIDAQSSKIIVNIKDYGNELIEVKDNGTGMNESNARLAFKQHATSKISSEDDLHKINSFGFRGEALASISSVAEKVKLETKTDSDPAVKLIIENTSETVQNSSKTEEGTTIAIYNLFKNIPARKKFLKSDTVELKHLTETFINISLPHLNIHFEFYHNEKLIYRLTKTKDFKNRVFEVWGKNIAGNLFEEKIFENSEIKIAGYFGKPEIGRKSTNLQYTYVNKRYIVNKTIYTAVAEAYRGFIHKDLKPAYFLFIEINPDKIDVNIHPRKTEIRFLNSQEIFKYSYSLARKTLENLTRNIITDTFRTSPSNDLSNNISKTTFLNQPKNQSQNTFSEYKTSQPSFLANDTSNKTYKPRSVNEKVQEALSFTKSLLEWPTLSEIENDNQNQQNEDLQIDNVLQVFNTYILFQRGESLILLDQHASAEKILFEKLYHHFGELKTKPLLIPEVIELKYNDKELILEKKEDLQNIGIIIEDFGQDSIQVLEIPEPVSKFNILEYLDEITKESLDLDKAYEEEKESYSKLNKQVYMLIATAACHGSIRAGQKLEKAEMISIIQNLLKIKNPYNCPHGRPTMWQIEKTEIEKSFKRRF